MSEPRIRTRCPSCGHDTLIIDDAGYLVCSLIGCEKPTMIGDVAAEIARLKDDRDQWKSIADEGRKAGREEAVQILLMENAESPLENETGSRSDQSGEWTAFWNEAALRKKFDVEPGATASVIEGAESAYWTIQAEIDTKTDEIKRLKADAAKDAEKIDMLAQGVHSWECSSSSRSGDQAEAEADSILGDEYGLRKVDGKWSRVK